MKPYKKETKEEGQITEVAVSDTSFTNAELHDALMWVQDHLERTGAPFVVLGDVARELHDREIPNLKGGKIEVGIMKRHWTKSANAISHMRIKQDIVDGTEIFFRNVPIVFRIIEEEYPFFKNPDVRFYTLSEFRIANPFEKYWEIKDNL